jgi:hypothetical protein
MSGFARVTWLFCSARERGLEGTRQDMDTGARQGENHVVCSMSWSGAGTALTAVWRAPFHVLSRSFAPFRRERRVEKMRALQSDCSRPF